MADRESFAGPQFEAPEAVFAVVGLALPVVLASHDQSIGALPRRRSAAAFQADVMIGVGGIPVQRARDGVPPDARADYIGPVRTLSRMNGQVVVNWRVGGHDDRAGGNSFACCRFGGRMSATFQL